MKPTVNITRIACIEDDPEYSKLLEEVLHMQPDILCMLSANSVESFWEKFPERGSVDVLFVDINLPGQSGVDAIPALRRRFPGADIVILTRLEDEELLFRALHNGASGYLNKDFPLFQIPQFIKILRNGGALLSPLMARKLVQYFNPQYASKSAPGTILSAKESQVLRLFSEGASYEEAASAMGVTVDGVRYHVRKIYRKLNVDNKIDAIRTFKIWGKR